MTSNDHITDKQVQRVNTPRAEAVSLVSRNNIHYDYGKLIIETVSLNANEAGFVLLKEIVGEWAHDAPQEADQWIQHSIPNRHLAGQLRAQLISTWADRDPVEVAGYLAMNESSPAFDDPALSAYALSLAVAVPSEAEHWAELIRDNPTRLATLQAIRRVSAQ